MLFQNELIEKAFLTSTFSNFHCFTASGINKVLNDCNLHQGIISSSLRVLYEDTLSWDIIKKISLK